MSNAKKYLGGCHCHRVRFETTVSLDKVYECNCSICGRVAALRAFTPASEFKLLGGQDALTDYQFGKQHLHHLFCRFCGVHSFATGTGPDGVEMRAVNVRCLDGVEPGAFEVTRFEEGRSWSWSVAGHPATDHVVEDRGADASRVTFGMPWIVTPYLVVCRVALRRLDELGRREVSPPQIP